MNVETDQSPQTFVSSHWNSNNNFSAPSFQTHQQSSAFYEYYNDTPSTQHHHHQQQQTHNPFTSYYSSSNSSNNNYNAPPQQENFYFSQHSGFNNDYQQNHYTNNNNTNTNTSSSTQQSPFDYNRTGNGDDDGGEMNVEGNGPLLFYSNHTTTTTTNSNDLNEIEEVVDELPPPQPNYNHVPVERSTSITVEHPLDNACWLDVYKRHFLPINTAGLPVVPPSECYIIDQLPNDSAVYRLEWYNGNNQHRHAVSLDLVERDPTGPSYEVTYMNNGAMSCKRYTSGAFLFYLTLQLGELYK